MNAAELAKKIRYLQIFTSKAANTLLAGEYKSVFKGHGIEFDEVREYQPGDDIRTIDWNVTARSGKPFVKRFREERELVVVFLVDLSASCHFGTALQLKREASAETCALISFAAVNSNDRVGLIAFTDQVEKFIPPGKGARHVLRILRDILNLQPQGAGTDIAQALHFLMRVFSKRAMVFLVSDFQCEAFEKPLRIVARKHDVIAINVRDPREFSLPDVGLIRARDPETGGTALFDTSSPKVRHNYETRMLDRYLRLSNIFRSAKLDELVISTDKPVLYDLVKFLKYREKKRR